MDNEKSEILYVDDEETNLLGFSSAFRRFYTIYTAKSGSDAIGILKEHPTIKIIITDQRMPEMTGIQFLESIIPEYPDPIRMILTGFSDIEAIIKSINVGNVFRYLTKPWEEKDLKQIIDTAISVYDLESEKKGLIKRIEEKSDEGVDLTHLLSKYIPESVMGELQASSGSPEKIFQGEIRVTSVLMGEIHGFPTLASKLSPKAAMDFLSGYFSVVNDCVKKNKGTTIYCVGSKYMAVFGAPIAYLDNQQNAVQCSLETMEAIKKFSEEHMAEVSAKTILSIGINTGDTIIGNITTKDRIVYSAVGNTVNTASHIAEIARKKPYDIIISQSTYNVVQESFQFDAMEAQTVAGEDQKMILYKVKSK